MTDASLVKAGVGSADDPPRAGLLLVDITGTIVGEIRAVGFRDADVGDMDGCTVATR